MSEWVLQGWRAQEKICKNETNFYTLAKQFYNEIKKIIPFTIVSIILTKYLKISLTKEMQSLFSVHYRVLLKEIKFLM